MKVPNVVPPFNLAQVIALKAYTAERAKMHSRPRKSAKGKNRPIQPAAYAAIDGNARSHRRRFGFAAARVRNSAAHGGVAVSCAVAGRFAGPRRGG